MIETAKRAPESEAQTDTIGPSDAAAYIFEIALELAALARQHGIAKAAFALEQARAFAAEAMVESDLCAQPGSENAAPGDAA